MSGRIEVCLNQATEAELAEHLVRCDANFVPPLSGRVVIKDYAKKIIEKAMRFEAWSGSMLVGLVAVYCNDGERRVAFVTSVSVMDGWQGKGIASQLMERSIGHAKEFGFEKVELEVDGENANAIRLYEKAGFKIEKAVGRSTTMSLNFGKGE